MNYYLGYYQTFLTFLATLVCFILLLWIVYRFYFFLQNRFKIEDKWWYKILSIIMFLSVPLLCVLIPIFLYTYLCNGKVNELYIYQKDNNTRLVVSFLQEGFVTMGSVYSHLLKSYDFKTGKRCGNVDLAIDTGPENYEIYGLIDNYRAWGYRYRYGVELLDLYEAKVLCDTEEILRRNPQLGDLIDIAPGKYDYVFNPRTKGIKVVTAWGEIYEIGTDLKAIPAKDIPYLPEEPVESDSLQTYREWDSVYLPPGVVGKAFKAKDAPLSPNHAVLIYPVMVSRMGEEVKSLDKAWVMHWSTLLESSQPRRLRDRVAGDCLLSYVNENGEIIIQYNLRELMGHKKFKAYSVTCHNNEMFVFISKAEFSLTALRVDRDTGEILGRVDYF